MIEYLVENNHLDDGLEEVNPMRSYICSEI